MSRKAKSERWSPHKHNDTITSSMDPANRIITRVTLKPKFQTGIKYTRVLHFSTSRDEGWNGEPQSSSNYTKDFFLQ